MKLSTSGVRFKTSEKVILVSYKILPLFAIPKKSHTISKTLRKYVTRY